MKYFFLGLIAILLLNCQHQKNDDFSIIINKDELPKVKSIIIEGYNTYDSSFFSIDENRKFRNFIKNELDSSNLYYDDIVFGFSIKHFSIIHSDFEFVLIRGTDGAFYYMGLTDMFYYKNELLNKGYNQQGYFLSCDSCKIDILENKKSGEVKILNEILKKDPFFNIDKQNMANEDYYAPNVNCMIVFVYYIYQSYRLSHYHIKQPLFKEVDDLENELNLLHKNNENKRVKELISKYEKLTYYYPDKRVVFFEQPYAGLFLFYIEYSSGKFGITKEFIPASKIFLQ